MPPGANFFSADPNFFMPLFSTPRSTNFLQAKKQILQAYFYIILQFKRRLIFPHFSQVPPIPPIQHGFSPKMGEIPHRWQP